MKLRRFDECRRGDTGAALRFSPDLPPCAVEGAPPVEEGVESAVNSWETRGAYMLAATTRRRAPRADPRPRPRDGFGPDGTGGLAAVGTGGRALRGARASLCSGAELVLADSRGDALSADSRGDALSAGDSLRGDAANNSVGGTSADESLGDVSMGDSIGGTFVDGSLDDVPVEESGVSAGVAANGDAVGFGGAVGLAGDEAVSTGFGGAVGLSGGWTALVDSNVEGFGGMLGLGEGALAGVLGSATFVASAVVSERCSWVGLGGIAG